MKSRLEVAKLKGFTLVELMVGVAIIGIIASIAYPSYLDYIERTKIEIAIADITLISGELDTYYTVHNSYPDSLSALGLNDDALTDEWGFSYRYLNIATVKGNGKLRKDHSLVPINTDYDLYSVGKDGKTASPLTSALSRDDIVRAKNGAFIGKATDY
jgi:general secretion pathway protein G